MTTTTTTTTTTVTIPVCGNLTSSRQKVLQAMLLTSVGRYIVELIRYDGLHLEYIGPSSSRTKQEGVVSVYNYTFVERTSRILIQSFQETGPPGPTHSWSQMLSRSDDDEESVTMMTTGAPPPPPPLLYFLHTYEVLSDPPFSPAMVGCRSTRSEEEMTCTLQLIRSMSTHQVIVVVAS
jgi:hypothetical protein